MGRSSDGAFFLPASAETMPAARIVDQPARPGAIKGMRLATAWFVLGLPCFSLAGCASDVTTVFGEGGAGGSGNAAQNAAGQTVGQTGSGQNSTGQGQTSTGQATAQTSTGQGTVATTSSGGPATSVTVGSTGSGMTCDDTFDCGACVDCSVASNCAMQYAACEQSMQCPAFIMCAEDCQNFPDPEPCYQECAEAYPQGANLYFAMVECIVCDTCVNSCGGC